MQNQNTLIIVGPEDQQRLEAIEAGTAPRLDYRAVADHCQGIIRAGFPSPAGFRGAKITRSLRSLTANTRFALSTIRSAPKGSIIFSTGETWGLPIGVAEGLSGQRHIHVMVAHRVYSANWRRLIRGLWSLFRVDGWLCYTSVQAQLLQEILGPRRRAPIVVIPQGTDTRFFDPDKASPPDRAPYILSIGNEMRNYPLLFEAARSFSIEVMVKASSAWTTEGQMSASLPPNVRPITQRLSYVELRDLYAGAQLVVVPLQDTPQAAGLNAIYEALAMKKCVIATRSRGLPDELMHDVTGVIVEPTADSLAAAIMHYSQSPEQAQRLAAAGQEMIRNKASMEIYTETLGRFLNSIPPHPSS